MDMQKLKCAVSLARHLNFTRAAEENYITQPTMTAKVNAVEAEVGVELFSRTSRSVRLTPEGKVFVETAAELIATYEGMLSKIQSMHSQKQFGTLILGYNSLSAGSIISHIAGGFKNAYPFTDLQLTKTSISELNQYLLDDRAQIVISNHFEMESNPTFHYELIVRTTPCVYVPSGNPLAQKQLLSLEDLEGQRLLCSCSAANRNELSAAAKALRDAGIRYQADSLINNEEAIMSMVEAGLGCYPAAKIYSQSINTGIACVPIDLDVDKMEIVVAWIKPELASMACHIKEIAQRAFMEQ